MKFIFILFLAFISISCETKYNEYQRPNFIFYISDDQDFLDYKIYGNDLIESSGVSKIAEDGILFTNALLLKRRTICCSLFPSPLSHDKFTVFFQGLNAFEFIFIRREKCIASFDYLLHLGQI